MRSKRLVDNTKAVLNKYGITASKRFGQNFVTDPSVLEDIVRASQISKEENALEIGPGLGTLTEFLAERAGKVVAVEVDKSLIPVLKDTLRHYGNIEIINADILKLDILSVMGKEAFRIIANLPYYITTPILMSLLESRIPCRSITVMVQKEVGERMTAVPGSKSYGALTLAVNYYTTASIVRKVPAECFLPQPKVDSVVVHLDIRNDIENRVKNEELMFSLIRGAFNQRRKTLVNALNGYAGLNIPKDRLTEAVQSIGAKPSVRGEELSLDDFSRLADVLS